MALVLVSLNASLEPYNGSRSQKSHNNIIRMLSVVYFHCKTIRIASLEKSSSNFSHFWPHKSGFFYRFKGGVEKHCTRASLHSDSVEDLIRISVEGSSLEDVDARESVASWFSQGQRSRRLNYRSWPSRSM